MSILSENIKNRRLELGLTQTDLAQMLGYSDRSAISKIEKGEVDLQQSKVYAFAKALRVDPSELTGWDSENPTQNEREFLDLFHQLRPSEQIMAISMVRDLVKLLESNRKENDED